MTRLALLAAALLMQGTTGAAADTSWRQKTLYTPPPSNDAERIRLAAEKRKRKGKLRRANA